MTPRPTKLDPHVQTRLRLLDLAEDASLYLRRHTEPTVRVTAALLLATSLAACSPSSATDTATESTEAPAVAPLAQEVKTGLPTDPGTYAVSPSSVTRDAQGVYGFTWRNATGADTWTQARASLMQLVQGNDDALIVGSDGDPILRLKPDTAITLPDEDGTAADPTPTPGTSQASTTNRSYGHSSILWYPFLSGGGATSSGSGVGATGSGAGAAASAQNLSPTTPAYRNPPAATAGQGSVRGSSSTVIPPSSSARTWVSPSRAAATGQAGGPGRGTSASTRSGSLSGPASGAARPGSSWFSGGRSGASSGSSSS